MHFDVLESLQHKESTLALFLDLSKAFDTIDHDTLLHKLSYYGIRGSALDWFKSYLSDRKQYVSFKGAKSSTLSVSCGVPQGSVLGPLLFIIYTNDLPDAIKRVKCILFADDTTLYISSKNLSTMYGIMNSEINVISDWFKANKLSLNASKTNYMLIGNRPQVINAGLRLEIERTPMEKVNSTKFLGVHIDDQFRWHEHIDNCRKKIRSGVYALRMAKNVLDTKNLLQLYYALVHPHLQYCNLLWGSAAKSHLRSLELLQKRAVRTICRSNFNEHTGPLLKKLHILKLDDIHTLQLGSLVYRFTNCCLPESLSAMFRSNNSIHSHNTRHKKDIHAEKHIVDTVFRSFVHQSPKIWAYLPTNIKTAHSSKSFCARYKRLLFSDSSYFLIV